MYKKYASGYKKNQFFCGVINMVRFLYNLLWIAGGVLKIPIQTGIITFAETMKQFYFSFCMLFCCFFANAQVNDSIKQFTVDSNIIQDKRVNELVLKHVLINQAKKEKMKGYRVQIHFGPEKGKAMDVRTKFNSQYNSISSYLDYQQPYFKIRAGDFRTKLEAYKLLQEISGSFPGAFIVSDDIELPRID